MEMKLLAHYLFACKPGLAFSNWQTSALKCRAPWSLALLVVGSRSSGALRPTMLPRVGQACGLFWSSVSITMSESLKPSRLVSRYFMQ